MEETKSKTLKYSSCLKKAKVSRVLTLHIGCVLLFFYTIIPSFTYSQTVVDREYLSKFTEDTIKYKVWVPKDWNKNDHYPSIYINKYGALSGNGMLAAAYINNFMNSFPKSIVIEITSGDMKNMNYSYETGEVGERGKKFISSLKNELIPSIENEFNSTKFRAFVGQSYSASYSNYLFLNEPSLFNAYILFAPERLKEGQPTFEITEELKAYYKTHRTLYYIAPAGNDIDRRKNYARKIEQELHNVDSSNFHFKLEMFAQADHNSIVTHSLLSGLTFIFSRYTSNIKESQDLVQTFKIKQKEIKDIYGLEIPRNSKSQSPFLGSASSKKDRLAMDFVADYFQDSSASDNALMLFNTAYVYYDSFNDFGNAERYFKMSIESAKKDNIPIYILNGYSWMSQMYLDGLKDFTKAWAALEEGYRYTHSSLYHYKLGSMAAKTGKNLDKGIESLLAFLNDPPKSFPEKEMFKEEGAYLLLSKCFYKKKELRAAKEYLLKSLSTNDKYDAALEWKAESKL
jgi:predicted alpha/beta superfamily hydrolase